MHIIAKLHLVEVDGISFGLMLNSSNVYCLFLLAFLFGSAGHADDLIFEGSKPTWIPKTDAEAKAEREQRLPNHSVIESFANPQKTKHTIKDPFAGTKWTPVDPSSLNWDEKESKDVKSDSSDSLPAPASLSATSSISKPVAPGSEKKTIEDMLADLSYKAQAGDALNFKEVTFSIRKSDKLDPNSDEAKAIALEKEAQVLSKDMKYKEAYDLLDKAVKLDPYSGEQLYNRGLVAQRINKARESIKDFELAQKLSPAIANKCTMEAARSTALTGEKQKAIDMLWGLKVQAKDDRDLEKMLDCMLVHYGDEKSLSNNLVLSNASDTDLRAALGVAAKNGKTELLQKVCNVLQGRPPSVKNFDSIGYGLWKLNKPADAMHAYKSAQALDFTDDKATLGVVTCAVELGQLDEVQAAKKAYLAHNPDGYLASTFRQQVSYYDKDFEQTKTRENRSSTHSNDTPHFSKTCMPLKVYVPDFDSATSSWKSNIDRSIDYMGAVQKAMSAWAGANSIVSFQQTSSIDDAHIAVEWVGNSSNMVHSFAAGVTGVTTNSKGGYRHYVKLLVPKGSDASNEQRFNETTIHEFGHALGLSHSSSPKDIMYFSQVQSLERRAELSENDTARIRDLYKY